MILPGIIEVTVEGLAPHEAVAEIARRVLIAAPGRVIWVRTGGTRPSPALAAVLKPDLIFQFIAPTEAYLCEWESAARGQVIP